jgi:hypothetical protein
MAETNREAHRDGPYSDGARRRSAAFGKFQQTAGDGSSRRSAEPSSGVQWVHLASEQADLMFALPSEPVIAGQPAVLFYLYSPNLVALREHLLACGVKGSAIRYSEYMPEGEIRVDHPDAYCLLIGQAG